jgi:amino acid adenylation domain-containing protein
MSVLDLINRLRTQGIGLSLQNGKLRLKAEKGALTDDLKNEIISKRSEIIALLGSAANSDDEHVSIPKADRTENLPLSFAQQRLWFLDALEPGTPLYNMPFASRIKGTPDTDLLELALQQMLARHESLRTKFEALNGQPAQCINVTAELKLEQVDACTDSGAELQERLTGIAKTSFDLSTAPLLRTVLIKTGANAYTLMLVFHHVIADLWSVDVFLRELSEIYTALSEQRQPQLPELDIQYADYAAWQRDWLSGEKLQKYLDFWTQNLAGAPEVLNLPTDYPRPSEPSYNGNWIECQLPADLSSMLKTLARDNNSTTYMLFLAAFNILLSRYSGEQDVVIGTPVAGRDRRELENLIGFFLNTLVVRTEVKPDEAFTGLLARTRKDNLQLREYQELPFERLVEELQPERDMSVSPVFQVMFIWQEKTERNISLPGLTIGGAELVGHGTAKFDLSLSVSDQKNSIAVGIEYATDLFSSSTIERMLLHFETLLRAITDNPQQSIKNIRLLDSRERSQQLEQYSGTTARYSGLAVHELIEQQVIRTPAAIALESADERLSYAELNARANVLAHAIIDSGVMPGDTVAVCAGRELNTVIAALAAIKVGANYTPLDPEYPAERLSHMLSDCSPTCLLSTAGVSAELPEHDAKTILIDRFDFTAGNMENPSVQLQQAAPLYTIYTSGSTGKPKGVVLPQATISNLSDWQSADARLGKPARTLQFAPSSFDVNIQELFTTWASGGTLVMIDADTRRDMPALAQFIADHNVQRLYLPFAALRPLAESISSRSDLVLDLKDVITAGEQLQITPALRTMFKALPECRLHNQYGPSETHVVTALTLDADATSWPTLPSIGTPVVNCKTYVLDETLQPVPLGAAGELCLGGCQVALGYLDQPELNAERFVANPFVPGTDLYRTGDQARFNANGEIEFLGRIDDQVKFRGFRIEPGEIAAKLSEHPSVQQALVLLRQDIPGNPQLTGYVVSTDDSDQNTILKHHLKKSLPDYMIPATIVRVAEFSLTPSGKINTRQLPAPDLSSILGESYVAPTNPVEIALCDIWAQILGLDQVGINDDFFSLGGHSLLATQVLSRVRDQLEINLPLKYLFRYPTAEELGQVICALQATAGPVDDTAIDGSDIEEFSL